MLGGQNDQHDDSLGPCTCFHYIGTLFSHSYDIKWLIDGKFRGVSAKVGDFTSIAMFRGGRRQILLVAASKRQY